LSEKLMEKLLNELTTWAKTQPEIMALYLYGSQAEKRANALSDLDVAILVRPEVPKSQLWRLEDRWAVLWPEYIDLRLLNLAPLSFRYEVTANGYGQRRPAL
jgi:predicted nucleotidyltransferase